MISGRRVLLSTVDLDGSEVLWIAGDAYLAVDVTTSVPVLLDPGLST